MTQITAKAKAGSVAADPQRKTVDPRTESRSRWLWVAFILCFFGLQALLWTSALSLVRKHPIRPVNTVQQEAQNDSTSQAINAGEEKEI